MKTTDSLEKTRRLEELAEGTARKQEGRTDPRPRTLVTILVLLSVHFSVGGAHGAADAGEAIDVDGVDLPLHEWTARFDTANVEAPKKLVVSPDDSRVFVVGYGNDFVTAGYSALTGQTLWSDKIRVQGGPSFGEDIAVSPDGSVVYATGRTFDHDLVHNGTTVAYDAATGARLWMDTYDGPASGTEVPNGIVVSEDGSRVFVTMVSAGFTTTGTSSDIATIAYDTATGARLWVTRFASTLESAEIPNDIVLSNDGTRVYVTGYTNALATQFDIVSFAYDATTGTQLWRRDFSGPQSDYAFRALVPPDGEQLVVVGETDAASSHDLLVLILDGPSGEIIDMWTSEGLPGVNGVPGTTDEAMYGAALSPDGRVAYVSGYVYEPEGDWDVVVVAVDLSTASTLWWKIWAGPDGGGDYSSTLATGPTGLVHVGITAQWGGTPSAVLVTLDPADGELQGLWRHEPGFGLDSPQHVVVSHDGEHAYVALTETVSNSPLERDIVVHAYRVLPPPYVPSAPLDLVVSPGFAQAALAWSPPADDGRRPVESYHVYRGTAPGGPYLDLVCVTAGALACVDATLSHEDANYYVVSATNSIGEGLRSSETMLTADMAPVPVIQGPSLLFRVPAAFTSASTDADGTISATTWDMGDGMQLSGGTVTHRYMALGQYEIRLSVTDDRGVARTMTRAVDVVNAGPNSAFDSSEERVRPWEPVVFTSRSWDPDVGIASWAWDLGDGTVAIGPNVSHAFTQPGTYVVTHTVTDGDGASSTSSRILDIRANLAPIADFGIEELASPTGSFRFSDMSSDADGRIVSRLWKFDDGASASGTGVTHRWLDAGPRTVELEVTDEEGRSATRSIVFPVDDTLVASVSVVQAESDGLALRLVGAWLNGTPVASGYSVEVLWEPVNGGPRSFAYGGEGVLLADGAKDVFVAPPVGAAMIPGRYLVSLALSTDLGFGANLETAAATRVVTILPT